MKKILSILLVAVMLVSAVCVSVSAEGYYLQERFSNGGATFDSNFIAGATWITDDGKLIGYSDARTFMSRYDDSDGVFNNTMLTWLEYDVEIQVWADADENAGDSRDYSLAYCNDNLVVAGIEEDRSFISFGYDFVNGEFYLSKVLGGGGEEDQLVARVAKEIKGDEFNKLGMTVTRGRIRGYFNGELIIDFVDTADTYRIAKEINSPFLFWNTSNFFQVASVDVASPEYIYPAGLAPVTTAETTNGGNNGNNGGNNDPANTTNSGNNNNPPATSVVTSVVTNDKGETEIVTKVVEVPADTNQNGSSVNNSTKTGDAAIIVAVAMVVAFGTAIVVKKVNVK